MLERIVRAGRAALAAAALAASATASDAQTVRVGSKTTTEQLILGEMYAAALEASGLKVERKINLGGTLIVHRALTSGEIDLYPEYTGSALRSVLKAPMTGHPDAVYRQVRAYYEREFEVTWLKPSGVNNGTVLLARADTAAEYNLKSLSDLARVAARLTIGAGPDFADRRDGLPGLKEKYGIEFAEHKELGALAQRYDALASRQIDVANGFATDWQIAGGRFVVLEDGKTLFPPSWLVPVVRMATIGTYPRIELVANQVSALIDNEAMRGLNKQVEVHREPPRGVAQAFLRSKGLIR